MEPGRAEEILQQLQPGDIVRFWRVGGVYFHYAIYIGDNEVIHWYLNDGKTDEKSKVIICGGNLTDVAGPNGIVQIANIFHIKSRPLPKEEILARANDKLGKTGYHFLLQNCEHFATWCRYGEEESLQVKTDVSLFIFIVLEALYIWGVSKVKVEPSGQQQKRNRQPQRSTTDRGKSETSGLPEFCNDSITEMAKIIWTQVTCQTERLTYLLRPVDELMYKAHFMLCAIKGAVTGVAIPEIDEEVICTTGRDYVHTQDLQLRPLPLQDIVRTSMKRFEVFGYTLLKEDCKCFIMCCRYGLVEESSMTMPSNASVRSPNQVTPVLLTMPLSAFVPGCGASQNQNDEDVAGLAINPTVPRLLLDQLADSAAFPSCLQLLYNSQASHTSGRNMSSVFPLHATILLYPSGRRQQVLLQLGYSSGAGQNSTNGRALHRLHQDQYENSLRLFKEAFRNGRALHHAVGSPEIDLLLPEYWQNRSVFAAIPRRVHSQHQNQDEERNRLRLAEEAFRRLPNNSAKPAAPTPSSPPSQRKSPLNGSQPRLSRDPPHAVGWPEIDLSLREYWQHRSEFETFPRRASVDPSAFRSCGPQLNHSEASLTSGRGLPSVPPYHATNWSYPSGYPQQMLLGYSSGAGQNSTSQHAGPQAGACSLL